MESLKGHLLIASPQLADPNFVRTVVLLVEHNDQGAFGVVLNRPSNFSVKDFWDSVTDEPCDCLEPINVGGPVEGPLLAIHKQPMFSETEVIPGVYIAAQRDHLDSIVRQGEPFRVFSGYSGWGAGQLETELKRGGWITMAAKSDFLFAPTDDLWYRTSQAVASDVLISTLKIKHVPSDPSLN